MHYYVLKERDQEYDPVVGGVIHASTALVTSTLCKPLCLLSLGVALCHQQRPNWHLRGAHA